MVGCALLLLRQVLSATPKEVTSIISIPISHMCGVVCWLSLGGINMVGCALLPQVFPNSPIDAGSQSLSLSAGSGSKSNSSAKTGKSRSRTAAATLSGPNKSAGVRKGEGRGAVRDEAARARNARNQQLHRQRQKVTRTLHMREPQNLCLSVGIIVVLLHLKKPACAS